MARPEGLPALGAEPIAAVFGGILLLVVAATALILFRNRLQRGPALHATLWILLGGLAGGATYLGGLWVIGRAGELAQPLALFEEVPWAFVLIVTVSAAVSYLAGARTGWHPAGVGILIAMVLSAIGWGAYLATTRVPALFTDFSVFSVGLALVLLAQLLALAMLCSVTCYMLDGLVRRRWMRRASDMPHDADHVPHVALHVASYDEPPEIVVRTLDSLVALDYPPEKVHIILADDTRDPAAVVILRDACAARGITFMHREDRRGFKAGALNDALGITPPEVELVAIIDADFVVDRAFLRDNVGYFAEPKLAFIQTKLWFGNMDESFTARYATLMEHFFYTSMMRTRNEGNSILFCGTMGILRRKAIDDVGGWTDGHVGEDVDLSCRMLSKGWTSLYVPKVYGQGIQTVEQEAFRDQQARWAYGGARILRDHGGSILRGPMTLRQKAHHLYPPFFWLDGSLALLFALGTMIFGIAFVVGQVNWIPVQELVFVGLIPVLVLLENMLRAGFTMRRLIGIDMKDVSAMIIMGWSGKLKNSISAWAAILGVRRPFHRTPKTQTTTLTRGQALRRSFEVAPAETLIGGALWTVTLAMMLQLLFVGSGVLPVTLVLAAILMSFVWSCYFTAAPLCVYLNHASRTAIQRASQGKAAAAARRRAPA